MADTKIPQDYPNIRRITLTLADTWYGVAVEGNATKVSYYPETNAARLGTQDTNGDDLADGDSYASTDHFGVLPADAWTETNRKNRRNARSSFMLSSASAGTVVAVVVEGE